MKKDQLVEIARSFSYKYFPEPFKPVDFFCSQKAEVPFKDAGKTSKALYQFCKKEVMESVNEYIREEEEKNTIQVGYPGGKVYKGKEFKRTPEEVQRIIKEAQPTYIARRNGDGSTEKVLVTPEMTEKWDKETIIH